MKIAYNISDKTLLAEPVLIVRFVPDAQRNQNFAHIGGSPQSDSLWGYLFYSSVLQEATTQMAFAEKGPFSSTFQSLPSCRINSGYHLCFDCWYPPFKQNKSSSGQRCFPTNRWVKELPIFQQFKTFLEKSQSQNNQRYQQGSRPSEVKDVLSTPTSDKYPFRFRLLCSYPLWQTNPGGQGRLQSSQKRRPVLPSFALFRVPFQRLLARYLTTRRCLQFHRLGKIPKRLLSQSSSLRLSHSSSGRCWLLRPQACRGSRKEIHRLLYCSQNDQTNQEQDCRTSLPSFQRRRGSSRILLPAPPVEKTTSLCSNPATLTRKRRRPTYSLYHKTLYLFRLCNQSFLNSRKDILFLSAKSRDRNYHQGTERKFRFSQNPNQQIPGEPSLFPPFGFCLQHRQLVQKIMFTSRIPKCYPGDYSDRILGSSCKVGQITTQKHSQITGRIYLQRSFNPYYSED